MENALLIGLSRQMALGRELEVVANNIANINTNGFKADNSVFQEFLAPIARENRFNSADRQVSFVQDTGSWHDFTQGVVQPTGNPLDVAIDGNAFLVVQTPAGERYTRSGALQLNAQGQIVTADGSPVMGDNGPIVLQALDSNIAISPDGRISVIEGNNNRTESLRGRFRMVSFADAQKLQKDGANNFLAPAGVAAQPATNARLVQGSVEKSNVSGVIEMTRMIDITRTYAQIANMIQAQSDTRKTAIEKLVNVPA